MKPFRRVERYLWSDVAMCSKDDSHWQYFKCHLGLPSASNAIPARWKAKFSGVFVADDTITIGGTDYTCTESDELTSTQFAPGEADEVVARIATINPTITGFGATYNGDSIYLTESTAGTGTAPEVVVTADGASCAVTLDRAYKSAEAGLTDVQLLPGDLLVVDTTKGVNGYDINGNLYVKPINASEYVFGTSKVAGFCTDFYTLDAGENEDIPVCVANCQFVKERLPQEDIYGNTISYDYTGANCLAAELINMNFRFGTKDDGGLY